MAFAALFGPSLLEIGDWVDRLGIHIRLSRGPKGLLHHIMYDIELVKS